MESIWKEKTNYYIKLPLEQLEEALDNMLVDIMGYSATGLTLVNVARGIKYLDNNEVVINIQISNSIYINEQGVLNFITSQDFDLAMYYFQIPEYPERLLSQEEYKNLKEIINLI